MDLYVCCCKYLFCFVVSAVVNITLIIFTCEFVLVFSLDLCPIVGLLTRSTKPRLFAVTLPTILIGEGSLGFDFPCPLISFCKFKTHFHPSLVEFCFVSFSMWRILQENSIYQNTEVGKRRFTVVSMQNTVYPCIIIINYCTVYLCYYYCFLFCTLTCDLPFR